MVDGLKTWDLLPVDLDGFGRDILEAVEFCVLMDGINFVVYTIDNLNALDFVFENVTMSWTGIDRK
jgi:hypothetical protein